MRKLLVAQTTVLARYLEFCLPLTGDGFFRKLGGASVERGKQDKMGNVMALEDSPSWEVIGYPRYQTSKNPWPIQSRFINVTRTTCKPYFSCPHMLGNSGPSPGVGKGVPWSLYAYNSTSSDRVMDCSQHRTRSRISAPPERVQIAKQLSETHEQDVTCSRRYQQQLDIPILYLWRVPAGILVVTLRPWEAQDGSQILRRPRVYHVLLHGCLQLEESKT